MYVLTEVWPVCYKMLRSALSLVCNSRYWCFCWLVCPLILLTSLNNRKSTLEGSLSLCKSDGWWNAHWACQLNAEDPKQCSSSVLPVQALVSSKCVFLLHKFLLCVHESHDRKPYWITWLLPSDLPLGWGVNMLCGLHAHCFTGARLLLSRYFLLLHSSCVASYHTLVMGKKEMNTNRSCGLDTLMLSLDQLGQFSSSGKHDFCGQFLELDLAASFHVFNDPI